MYLRRVYNYVLREALINNMMSGSKTVEAQPARLSFLQYWRPWGNHSI